MWGLQARGGRAREVLEQVVQTRRAWNILAVTKIVMRLGTPCHCFCERLNAVWAWEGLLPLHFVAERDVVRLAMKNEWRNNVIHVVGLRRFQRRRLRDADVMAVCWRSTELWKLVFNVLLLELR